MCLLTPVMGVDGSDCPVSARGKQAGVSLWLRNETRKVWGGFVLKENRAGAGGSGASNQSLPFYIETEA